MRRRLIVLLALAVVVGVGIGWMIWGRGVVENRPPAAALPAGVPALPGYECAECGWLAEAERDAEGDWHCPRCGRYVRECRD